MDLEKFPNSEIAMRMIGTVTQGFYDQSYVGKWLYQVMGMELEEVEEMVESLIWQVFVETEEGLEELLTETGEDDAGTATWALKYHEEKYGLPARADLDHKNRGKLIYKKRNGRFPMTPYRLEKILSDATGCEVQVKETDKNVIEVCVKPGSSLYNSSNVLEILNHLKQSHVACKTLFEKVTEQKAYIGCQAIQTLRMVAKSQKIIWGNTSAIVESDQYAAVGISVTGKIIIDTEKE